jgi:hypothetical protein
MTPATLLREVVEDQRAEPLTDGLAASRPPTILREVRQTAQAHDLLGLRRTARGEAGETPGRLQLPGLPEPPHPVRSPGRPAGN